MPKRQPQNIGRVATNWLITADSSPDGVWDDDCLLLAELHSDAVDYPKTGQPVPLENIPRLNLEHGKPDWSVSEVGRSGKTYTSQSWLGKLYREVELPELPQGNQSQQRQTDPGRDAGHGVTAQQVLDALHSSANSVNVLTCALRERMMLLLADLHAEYQLPEIDEIVTTFHRHVQDLRLVCLNYSLNYRRSLDEEEVVAGTIIAKTSQPRMRQDCMSQMREQATNLVTDVRSILAIPLGGQESEGEALRRQYRNLDRAWIAYTVSTILPDKFGSRSWQLVALGQFFETAKSIEDILSGYTRHRS